MTDTTDRGAGTGKRGLDGTDGADSETDPVALSAEHPVLLFDGVCNLCEWSVRFVIERDPEAKFRFAPLQSAVAEELLAACGYEGEQLDSVVLVDDGEWYAKSDAVIRATRYLGLPYSALRLSGVLPTRLRDRCYDFVAERRYRWFGKRDRCLMPTPERERRFLAGGPGEKSPQED